MHYYYIRDLKQTLVAAQMYKIPKYKGPFGMNYRKLMHEV